MKPEATTKICIHGMFRSGTNFVKAIIELNYVCEAEYDLYGWKHAFYPITSQFSGPLQRKFPSVMVTKNPFHALHSLYRYSKTSVHNIEAENTDLRTFCASEIVIKNGQNSASEYLFSTPVEYWNCYNWNLVTAARNARSTHVRYEDMVAAPEATAADIAAKMALDRKPGEFVVPENKMKNLGSKVHDESRFFRGAKFDVDGVKAHTYMEDFSPDLIAQVLARLSQRTLTRLGYESLVHNLVTKSEA